jgi:hypothetical protein
MPQAGRFVPRVLTSAALVPRDEWDALFGASAFDRDFCTAAEAAPPPGFSIAAIGVFDGPRIVAGAPIFYTHYRLDMSLPPLLRTVGTWCHRVAPRLMSVPMVGLGSPVVDRCQVGFSPTLDAEQREQAWATLLQGLQRAAQDSGARLLAIKDMAEADLSWADRALGGAHFIRLASLPVAVLELPFASEDAYLASLSRNARRDIKRKLRDAEGNVRFEVRDTIDDVEHEIAALYAATRDHRRADYGDFDALSPAYFRRVLEDTNHSAQIALGWVGDQLASFAMFLVGPDRLYAHQIGMRYPLAREHNLYFLNCMLMVRLAIERGLPWLELGQTCYAPKVRLGCGLRKSWVYFRHRSRPVTAMMGLLAPLAALDQMEPGSLAESARGLAEMSARVTNLNT